MRNRLAIAMFSAALAAAGCGGGGGTSTASQGQTGTQTVQLGPAQVSFTSKPTSQIGVAGQTVSVYGMAGTTFPDVIVDPPQSLINTEILFTGTDGTGGLWTYANGQITSIGGVAFARAVDADWTHDGHILFVNLDSISGRYQLFECNYDGSGAHRITNSQNIYGSTRAVWSPLNNLIAFDDGSSSIYTISTTGTGETLRVSGGFQPCFSPDGKTLAFEDAVNGSVSSIPVGGGAITLITTNPIGDSLVYPTYSLDGGYIMFTDETLKPPQLNIKTIAGVGAGFDAPTGASSTSGTFSPDGSQVAFTLDSVQVSGYQSLMVSGFTGYGTTTAVSPSNGLVPTHPNWSPFPGPQRFVAASVGTVLSSANGFLFGQAGDKFGGFVAFTAKTPADATITSEGTPTGTAPYSFDIHADEVTSLKYTNGLYSGVTTVSTGNYTDVFVSVSGITGQISYVAPVLQKRTNGALAKPVISHSEGNTIFSGSFAALYDAKGKNLAPKGLSQYRLDSKGNLLGFK